MPSSCFRCGETGHQIVELKDEADVLPAVARELGIGSAREVMVEKAHRAGGRGVESTQDVEERRLAAARCAEQHEELAGAQVEVE
jgi:hypothetical protein